jgi:hypothetical protein
VATSVDLTIRNPGGVGLSLGAITIGATTGCTATVLTQPPATVAPGGSATVRIRVVPSFDGPWTAALSLPSNDPFAAPLDVVLAGTAANRAPTVAAGGYRAVMLPQTVPLDGTVSDANGDPVAVTWTQVDGPGSAVIAAPTAVDTAAALPADGLYRFRLTARDATAAATAEVAVIATLPGTTVVDNGMPGATDAGGWSAVSTPGYLGTGSRHITKDGSATWSTVLPAGWYDAALFRVVGTRTATGQAVTVTSADGVFPGFAMDGATGVSGWQSLGLVRSDGAAPLRIRLDATAAGARADAARFIALNGPVIDDGSPGFSLGGAWVTEPTGGQARSSHLRATGPAATAAWVASFTGSAHPFLFRIPAPAGSDAWSVTSIGSAGTARFLVDGLTGQPGWVDLGRQAFAGTARITLANPEGGGVRADMVRLATDILLDNGQVGYSETGSWAAGTISGTGTTRQSSDPAARARWRVSLPGGSYRVWWYRVVGSGSATAAQVTVTHAGGVAASTWSLATGTPGWVDLGTFAFDGVGQVEASRTGTSLLRADAVRFEPVAATGDVTPTVGGNQ